MRFLHPVAGGNRPKEITMAQRQPKPQLVIATWVNDKGNGLKYLGDRDHSWSYDETHASFWLSLRERDPKDTTHWLSSSADVVSDIGLWVFVSAHADYTSFSVEPRLHGVHSADVRKAERLFKRLKGIASKMPEQLPSEGFESFLRRTFDRLGIRSAVEYRGINVDDTYCTINAVVPVIVAEFETLRVRCERNLKGRAA